MYKLKNDKIGLPFHSGSTTLNGAIVGYLRERKHIDGGCIIQVNQKNVLPRSLGIHVNLSLVTKISGLLAIIALVIIGYMVGINRRPANDIQVPQTQISPSPTQVLSSQQLLTLFQDEFSVSKTLITMHRDWQSQRIGRTIPLTGGYFSINAAEIVALKEHTVIPQAGGTSYEIRGSGLTILKDKIGAFFTRQGFVKNTQNSNRDEASYSLDETLAFEKRDVSCLVSVRTLDPVATFFCGTYDPAYEALRSEFIAVFNPSGDPEVVVEISAVEGNYATGGVGGRGGGSQWYAVKETGKWKVVFQGQINPPCSIMKQYQFPISLYKECDPTL